MCKNNEYDKEILQPKHADKPVSPLGRDTQQSRDTWKTNKAKQPALSLPFQGDCKTRMNTKLRTSKHT